MANIACKGTQYGSKILCNYINPDNIIINEEYDLDKTPYEYPNEPKTGEIIVDGTIPEPDPNPLVNYKNNLINPFAICVGCGKSINGVRYKCIICENFDYCEYCENKDNGKHGHPLLKINRPEMCPVSYHYLCIVCSVHITT